MSEIDKELIAKEEELFQQDDNHESPPSDIVAFNESRSCADIFRMEKSDQLVIKPDFQREIVWSNASKTRFIDSLIKQLPIPSMCISLDYKTDERLVIDGLQRISSIIQFLGDENWKLAKLPDVDEKISGKKVSTIKSKNKNIFSRVENLAIPITVLRCDYSKSSHMKYLFTIFHRLNTGGNKLTNQEIRNCIYSGSFNDLLTSIVEESNFKKAFGIVKTKTYRYSNQELVLRAIAFSEKKDTYNGGLANFLNTFMESKKETSDEDLNQIKHNFDRVSKVLNLKILGSKKIPRISKTTTEALLVGLYSNIDQIESETATKLRARFTKLRQDDLFSLESLKEGLSGKQKVIARLTRAIEIFS